MIAPTFRPGTKLMHRPHGGAEVVALHLRKRLVEVGCLGLGAERVTKLAPGSAERILTVAALVSVQGEVLRVVAEGGTPFCAPTCIPGPRDGRLRVVVGENGENLQPTHE